MRNSTADFPGADSRQTSLSPETSRAQSVTIFAVLLMQIALLVLGIMLYGVKSGADPESERVSSGDKTEESSSSSSDVGREGNAGTNSKKANKAATEKDRSPSLSKAEIDAIQASIVNLRETIGSLETQSTNTQTSVTRLNKSAEDTLKKLEATLKSLGAKSTAVDNKVNARTVDILGMSETMTKSLDRLEKLVSDAYHRDAAESNVIVIACETPEQRITPFLSAYKAAIYDNPSRSWFKKHRVGLWIAQGTTLNKVLPHDLKDLEEVRKKWEAFDKADKTIHEQSKADPTNLATEVFKDFSSDRLPVTRFVLVVPANVDAPAKGAWGKNANVDVVLVAARHDTPDTAVPGWVTFCSGRGLLSLLRPPSPEEQPTQPGPAPVGAPANPAAGTAGEKTVGTEKPADTANGGDPSKIVGGAPTTPNGAPPATAAAPPDASNPTSTVAKVDPVLLQQLTNELIRLTQPSPPSALDTLKK